MRRVVQGVAGFLEGAGLGRPSGPPAGASPARPSPPEGSPGSSSGSRAPRLDRLALGLRHRGRSGLERRGPPGGGRRLRLRRGNRGDEAREGEAGRRRGRAASSSSSGVVHRRWRAILARSLIPRLGGFAAALVKSRLRRGRGAISGKSRYVRGRTPRPRRPRPVMSDPPPSSPAAPPASRPSWRWTCSPPRASGASGPATDVVQYGSGPALRSGTETRHRGGAGGARHRPHPLYPRRSASLPCAMRIARHYAEAYGVTVGARAVVVTTGSSAGFVLASSPVRRRRTGGDRRAGLSGLPFGAPGGRSRAGRLTFAEEDGFVPTAAALRPPTPPRRALRLLVMSPANLRHDDRRGGPAPSPRPAAR